MLILSERFRNWALGAWHFLLSVLIFIESLVSLFYKLFVFGINQGMVSNEGISKC